jgi:hypothetical protein
MNTKDEIKKCLSGAREQKHDNYEAFLEEMAQGIDTLKKFDDITLRPNEDPLLADVRQKVIDLAGDLEKLGDKRDRLGPYAYELKALRQWCASTILLGEELSMRAGGGTVDDIETAVFILAHIWRRCFDKWPSAGGNSRFYRLCKLVPLKSGNKAVQEALNKHRPKQLVSKTARK